MDILACPLCSGSFRLSIHHLKKVETRGENYPGCEHHCEFISQPITSPNLRKRAHSQCPECYQARVTEGQLTCPNGHAFPIHGSIPRLHDIAAREQRTKETFDVEWKVFNYKEKIYGHSKQDELRDLFHRMVVDEVFLQGKTILDAGCGMGRLTRSVGHYAKEVFGIDFSHGVDEARLLTKGHPTVHILQGDLMNLPFKKFCFDYVYSKGVLHYVSDVQRCMAGLANLVKPDGALSVTLYPRMSPLFESFTGLVRRSTVRFPIKINYVLSYLLIPFLSLAWKWSGVKKRNIDWNERAHMIFNWLSSEFQNRASVIEVTNWFEGLGFDHLRLSSIPVGITGFRVRNGSDEEV